MNIHRENKKKKQEDKKKAREAAKELKENQAAAKKTEEGWGGNTNKYISEINKTREVLDIDMEDNGR